MKIYATIQEGKNELKAKTGKSPVRYFANGREVSPSAYRQAQGKETIYRSSLCIHAEKSRL